MVKTDGLMVVEIYSAVTIEMGVCFQTVKKALYKPTNQEVAVKMMQANAMSEDDFVLEATTMQ